MQNAGQYVPGTANAHPPQQFVPSEPSPNGGSTTSSLRQFRKRDVDKSQLEQSPKQESHVARVAPHNHYPPVSNDLYRYPPHQFSDYSPQVKYSDIAEASQPNPISTSVIQKPKPKDYMEMCNVQQQHLNNQQQYSPDNGQYMHRDPTQGYPTGFKPEAHYLSKDQHQYQQLAHHAGQPKFNPMMAQNVRKYNPGPADNPFLNKLSKIHPSMARSIISDHHLQDPQPSYSPMDQRAMYGQQNHRYYPSSLHQPNPYAPNHNYAMNAPHHYPNYPSASCSYPRTPTLTPRYSHMERSISPTRRGYPENMPMNHIPFHNIPQKMQAAHNYPPQYATGPEYAQHYQHRRLGPEIYPQACRPTQYMQNHHQIPAQEMQELPENRISPSDSLKKFIENWAADEEPSSEINPMESNMNLRDNIKVRDDAPPGTVYMINATDVQYFENNGIPIVTSDNGGIQLTSENYQYLIKNGLVDNSGMVRIIEANKEISIDSSGNHERIVNLQIMETSKSDCMMVNKSLRPNDGSLAPNGLLPKADEENRRVVIHQNTIINPGNCVVSDRIPSQQPPSQAPAPTSAVESISISKELVDKNCSPINLDQLENNLGFSEADPPEAANKNKSTFNPVCTVESSTTDSGNALNFKSNDISLSDDLSQNSDDSQNKSPGSKSMPIIDLFGDSHVEENETHDDHESDTKNSTDSALTDQTLEKPNEKTDKFVSEETSCREKVEDHKKEEEPVCGEPENKKQLQVCPLDLAQSALKKNDVICGITSEHSSVANSVIVSPESMKKSSVPKENTNCLENTASKLLNEETTYKKADNANLSESLNGDEPVSEKSPSHSKDKEPELTLENTTTRNQEDVDNKTPNLVDPPKTLVEVLPTTIERRKRIFSVDNIIHHIGNNMKRGSRELDIFCGTNTLTTFIEKEVEFSSIEQVLNIYYLKRSSSINKQDEDNASLDDTHLDEPMSCDNLVESAENVFQLEDTKEAQSTVKEPDIKLEMEESEIIITTKLPNEEPISDKKEIMNDDQLVDEKPISDEKEIINDDPLENKVKVEKTESTEVSIQTSSDPEMVPSVVTPDEPLLLEPDERSDTPTVPLVLEADERSITPIVPLVLEPDERSNTPTVPLILEPDERSNTPSIFQYRNAIRVEETSVLLQIAGELMEISVNIVNGKKVITVVPLADSTVVDYNDNYEISAGAQDTDSVQMNDSGIESEKMDVSENARNIGSEENASNKHGCQKESSALVKNQAETTVITVKEVVDVLNEEEGDKKEEYKDNASINTEKYIDQVQSMLDSKVNVNDILQKDSEVAVQEKHDGITSIETNKPLKSDIKVEEVKVDPETAFTSNSVENKDHISNSEHLITLDVAEVKIADSPPDITKIENPEIIEFPETSGTSVQLSEVVEDDSIENVLDEETIKSIGTSNTIDIYETPETLDIGIDSHSLQLPESLKTSTIVEALGKNEDIEVLISGNDTTIQQDKENHDNSVDIQNCPPKLAVYDLEHTEYDVKNQEVEAIFYDKTIDDNNEVIEEDNDNDLDAEHLDFQLEDDVFISEEPSHEIIVIGPLEGVGLVEEVDKTTDSFDIPLEPVSASDEIVENSQPLVTEKLDEDKVEPVIDGETIDSLPKSISQEIELPSNKTIDLGKSADKLNLDTSNVEVTPIVKLEKSKELVVKLTKPEVQILSPTSTNIDDHITTSKENVYLEPRRRFSTVDTDSESAPVPVTTKAAKKLYECDLQIPSVTTSGDISTKVSKKSIKYQHDTVSSSKRERVVKDSARSKKSIVKRSKRLTEKNLIKNEQKEMLRLLAEKRKQRKDAKQKETMRQKEGRLNTENNKEQQDDASKTSEIKELKEPKRKHFTENDEEYVDFKELLRARKLKKLKKMQEMKRRETKDFKAKTEEANKNVAKEIKSLAANKKAVGTNKSVTVSSSYEQENKVEIQTACCIGCNNSMKMAKKDGQQKIKKRKNSSEVKNKVDVSPVKPTNHYVAKTELTTSTAEVTEVKPNTGILVETKPIVEEVKVSSDVADNKLDVKPDLSPEIKSAEILEQKTTATVDVKVEENAGTPVPNVKTKTEKNNESKKVKPQKRVSFCDDISSSTSTNDNYSVPTEDITLLKVRTHSTSTPKDPRRRSKSYTGQVMVPSVSELIEENCGAVYKKKISLADYVSRKRKTSTETNGKTKSEENECIDKKSKLDSSACESEELVETLPRNYNQSQEGRTSMKTLKDVKTSFVIHSSDWEDSQSPIPTTVQSNEECLIQDFSGLIKSKSKKPVIDVNELFPLENLENPKDTKLQEYKDKVDSQLSSLIIIPKIKSQNSESKRLRSNLDPYGSPESSSLIKKFLGSEKITQSEMEKIKKIISYKRLIQHQKNARSPSKSPASSSSTYSRSPACSGYDLTCSIGGGSSYGDIMASDPPYEIKNRVRSEADSKEMRLHLKKVNAKRKLHSENVDDDSSSSEYQNESRHKKKVDYSVINRVGKDGQPKIIFKRNRQSNFSDDNQPVVELERIDDNLEMVEEKYKVTVTQLM